MLIRLRDSWYELGFSSNTGYVRVLGEVGVQGRRARARHEEQQERIMCTKETSEPVQSADRLHK
mgnify:CR=1 FL=1